MASVELLRFCAKYPFSSEAKELLNSQGFDFGKVSDETLEFAYDEAAELLQAQPGSFQKKLSEIRGSQESFLTNEIVAFPVSKILAALSGDRLLQRDFARQLANKVFYFLQFENDVVLEQASQFASLSKEPGGFSLSLTEYLVNLPEGKEFKLVNQQVSNGRVFFDKLALAKLVAQSVQKSALDAKIDKKQVPKMWIFFAEELKKHKKTVSFQDQDFGQSDATAFPPCFKKILADLKAGEKVGHISRFVLATFFANTNLPIDEATKLFSQQPNFNEKRTRYHLEHAYGTKPGTTKYSVPTCAKMQTLGVCAKDASCFWKHPLSYYAAKKGVKRKTPEKKTSERKT